MKRVMLGFGKDDEREPSRLGNVFAEVKPVGETVRKARGLRKENLVNALPNS
jgi:hypothetical protein